LAENANPAEKANKADNCLISPAQPVSQITSTLKVLEYPSQDATKN